MYRFYAPAKDIIDNVIHLRKDEAKHAFCVLRLKVKDKVAVFDGEGTAYAGTIRSLSERGGIIAINEIMKTRRHLCEIVLAVAIPKQSKFSEIVDKGTQLGAAKIIPLISQHTIVKIDSRKAQTKRQRWQKIAIAAAKQCGCAYVPQIEQVITFAGAMQTVSGYELALIASLHKGTIPLKRIINKRMPGSVIVFIGPEGDFSKQEVTLAEQNGCIGISLGKNTLRCDTAVSALLSILNYEWKS